MEDGLLLGALDVGVFPFETEGLLARRLSHTDPEDELRPGTRALPRLIPEKPSGALELKAVEGGLLLGFKEPTVVNDLDSRLLALWWVNGEPVILRRKENEEEGAGINRAEKLLEAKEVRLQLSLDRAMLEAKEGDRIAVQFLYAPHDSRGLPPHDEAKSLMLMQESGVMTGPQLSARVELED